MSCAERLQAFQLHSHGAVHIAGPLWADLGYTGSAILHWPTIQYLI